MTKDESSREKLSGALAIAAYMLTGIALLIWPQIVSTLALWVIVVLLCVFAGIRIFRYAKTPPKETLKDFSLATALMAVTVGFVLVIDRVVFDVLMPFVWGVLLMVAGFAKLQLSVDFYRMRASKWWLMLIAAVVSLALGILCAAKPEFLREILARFIGASLVAEGVIDLVAIIFFKRSAKKPPVKIIVPVVPEAAPQAPAAPKEDEQTK